jgi:hypothetical protein
MGAPFEHMLRGIHSEDSPAVNLAIDTILNFLSSDRYLTEKLSPVVVLMMIYPDFDMTLRRNGLQRYMELIEARLSNLSMADIQSEIENFSVDSIDGIFESVERIAACLYFLSDDTHTDISHMRFSIKKQLAKVIQREDVIQEFPEFREYSHLISYYNDHPDIPLLNQARDLLHQTTKSNMQTLKSTKSPNRKLWLAHILYFALNQN